MANSNVSFSTFLENVEGNEAGAILRNFGARLESGGSANWGSVRERALARAEVIVDRMKQSGIRLLGRDDAQFPESLIHLSDCPAWLFVQGNEAVLGQPSLTAVGTRNPSDDGIWLSRFVGFCFQQWQATTISGLATGIDQIVHEMSIRAGLPTVAVLGTGIFSDYPRGSSHLREQIVLGGGTIVTEYLPNDKYSAENFVRRNRIQAALGRVLIPIEWREKSGTAHTVRFAGSLSRPIAAIWLRDSQNAPRDLLRSSASFVIPGQEQEFRQFVSACLSEKKPIQPVQMPLI